MTIDEEKAEEYLEKHKEYTKLKGVYHLTIDEKQAYLDGLEEGRKEKFEMALSQIKNDREKVIEYNERLKKENEQLRKEKHYRDGYIDGLAEGNPEWHDLRKNPNDLPEERKKVLLCIEVTRKKFENFKIYIEGIHDKGECLGEYDSCWLYQEADKKVLTEIVDNQRVIAWCELPKFEE